VQWQCWIFVASWTGVIKYHGPRPESVRTKYYTRGDTLADRWHCKSHAGA